MEGKLQVVQSAAKNIQMKNTRRLRSVVVTVMISIASEQFQTTTIKSRLNKYSVADFICGTFIFLHRDAKANKIYTLSKKLYLIHTAKLESVKTLLFEIYIIAHTQF